VTRADGNRRGESHSPARPLGSDAQVIALLERIAIAVENRAASAAVLTAEQLASLLQIDLRTLRQLRRAGEAPREFSVGRSPRWRRADVERWMETRK
jgi:excisionase family DNA binding protein